MSSIEPGLVCIRASGVCRGDLGIGVIVDDSACGHMYYRSLYYARSGVRGGFFLFLWLLSYWILYAFFVSRYVEAFQAMNDTASSAYQYAQHVDVDIL